LVKGQIAEGNGDCIDCNMCVTVCPTGVDIREGNQIGCINCGLCADACDDIMERVNRPKGLVRFMSYNEVENNTTTHNRFMRPRPLFYMAVTTITFISIAYLLLFISPIEMNVNHERSPTFTLMSDRSIQNVYHMIVLNKTESAADFMLTTKGLDGAMTNFDDKPIHLLSGEAKKVDLRIKVPRKNLKSASQDVTITLTSTENPEITTKYKSAFFGPGN